MIEQPEQDALFTVADTPVPVPPRNRGNGRPRWSSYTAKNRVKCDDCMLLLAIRKGDAPASRFAQWKRQQDATTLLLCYAHARARREEDGMEPLG